jgi:hypothetical protein
MGGCQISEQSDKEYFIVVVEFKSKAENWKAVKSEILKRLITVHRELINTS